MSDAYDHEKTDREMLERYRTEHKHEAPDLGTALTRALLTHVGLASRSRKPIRPGTAGYSPALRDLIDRAIELDPALSESILKIAATAYEEGHEDGLEEGESYGS